MKNENNFKRPEIEWTTNHWENVDEAIINDEIAEYILAKNPDKIVGHDGKPEDKESFKKYIIRNGAPSIYHLSCSIDGSGYGPRHQIRINL